MKSSIIKMTAAVLAATIFSASGIAFANPIRPVTAPAGASSAVPATPVNTSITNVPAKMLPVEIAPAPDVIRKEMKVSGYQLVKVNGHFKVYLQQGDEQKIVVEADETLVPEVKHFIVDNTLNIYTSDQVKKRITLWITLKDINNLNKFGQVRVIRK